MPVMRLAGTRNANASLLADRPIGLKDLAGMGEDAVFRQHGRLKSHAGFSPAPLLP